ncbi:hypothetical protein [Gimesia algae]|uniref:Uncharacterized protein n=1 Tax=Gimesia algae TaxID=2527971 RepID=A0A517V833_9PLAN|nr:hypothetical protein [Gimesia algae]QDT89168.1 hypothetical protein Pan161_07940 [Gimesia algae]
MARYQVFIPHDESQRLDDMQPAVPLARVGLSDIIGGSSAQLSVGPEGKNGVIISWTTAGDTITGYHPDEQTWIPAAPSDEMPAGRYHVGIWNAKKPMPKELQRPKMHRGQLLVLGDGWEWLMPNIASLDKVMVLSESGEWVFESCEEYKEIEAESQRWLEILQTLSEGDILNWSDAFGFVVSVLKMNYRLTDEVVSHLKLFNQTDILKSLIAICEVPAYVR